MPSATDLLVLLSTMAHELALLATAWHLLLLVAVIGLLAGWRPTNRGATLLLVAPALTVAVAALAYGNPFNALSFAALALVLAYLALRLDGNPVAPATPWASSLGIALVAFGWAYPHFIGFPASLYASPIGVVPCPTLAVMGGLALLGGGFGSRAVPAALTAWTAFYALFGIVRLGVALDAGLLVAMVGLAALLAHNLTAGGPSRATGGA